MSAKKLILVCVCVLAFAVAVPAQAATITWGSKADVVDFWDAGPTPGDGDILVNGAYKAAVTSYETSLTVAGVPLTGAPIISGGSVTWAGSSISMSWSAVTGSGTPAIFAHAFTNPVSGRVETHATLTDTDYKKALHQVLYGPYVGAYPDITAHINFGSLTPGNTYQFQLITGMIETASILKVAGGPGGENMSSPGILGTNPMPGGWMNSGVRLPYLASPIGDETPDKLYGTFVADGTGIQTIHLDKYNYPGYGLMAPAVISLRNLTASAVIGLSPGSITLPTIITGAASPSQNISATESGGVAGNYNISAVTGTNMSVANAGSSNYGILANATNTHAVTYANTSLVGATSGTVTFTSGTGIVTGSPVTVSLTGAVLAHSNASFASPADQDALNLNLGVQNRDGAVLTQPLSIYNLVATAGYTAALDLDTITPGAGSSAFSTNLAGFLNLAAGSGNAFSASFDPAGLVDGVYTKTYTLSLSDQDLPGTLGGQTLTLNLSATVVPEPATMILLGTALAGLLRHARRRIGA